jgi:glucose/arabinose dehydrogenase
LAGESPVEPTGAASAPGDLAFGRLVEGSLGCDGALDYVHLRRGIHAPTSAASTPEPASDTLGLWRLASASGERVADLSPLKNDARVASPARAPATAIEPPPGNQLTAVDRKLKVVLLDRSADEAFLAVKVDSEGQVFVGGREAVFVFEPQRAGYGPKRELLRFPNDSIIIGLEFRGNDLYVLTSNALYRVPDGRKRRAGLRPERILWGLPLDLHVSFHCLAWGPQGDLYLDHGDPLLTFGDWSRPDHWGHWTLYAGPDGSPVPYTGQGAVLRVRPDGSNPRVVASGLRGPVGLAFDPRWNLFTNDNDHESRPDQYAPARLLHVTPHVDFAWPRGWMASKIARSWSSRCRRPWAAASPAIWPGTTNRCWPSNSATGC